MYLADATPWLGSVKHIWKTLGLRVSEMLPLASSWPPMTSVEEAEGVSSKMLSALASLDTAMHGAVVVVPMSICMPQSLRVLKALTDFSALFSSSSKR